MPFRPVRREGKRRNVGRSAGVGMAAGKGADQRGTTPFNGALGKLTE